MDLLLDLTILLIHIGLISAYKSDAGPTAVIENGKIRGQIKLSKGGRHFFSFTGIPYAKSPVGNLRFAAPQSSESWTTIRDATKDPPVCIQRNYLFSVNPSIEGDEDCLYINVYAPKLSKSNNVAAQKELELLPVMVFIHWGAFISGTSKGGYLGPEYFMDKDIVLVTFNYRLGPFGFLSTTDDEAPGNYGLKDQVLALKWVQQNIESFGGNKGNVTIFGQSAGAGSVHYHLLSPASKGLFHRAISQSGSALAGWAVALNDVQKQVTIFQAKFVGCENFTDTNKNLIECLKQVSAEDIMKTQDNFRTFFGNPLVVYGPVVETKSARNTEPFFTKTPLEYILAGEIEKVPWITGVVKNEGVLRAPSLIRSTEAREGLNQNFEKVLTEDLLGLQLSTAEPHSLYKNISKFYFNGKEGIDLTDLKTVQGFVDVYSDRGFFYPMYQSLLLHYKNGHNPIYLYSFEYKGTNSYADLFAGASEDLDYEWGVCHCDELLYLFNSTDLLPTISNWNDALMSRMLLTLWTNFAKYGNPNPVENAVHANLKWSPLNLTTTDKNTASDELQFLNITGSRATGPKLEISKGFYQERIKFWTDSDIYENIYLD